MSYEPGKHVYLAAPFFNDEQRLLVSVIESLNSENQPIYSPRSDGYVLTPDATPQEREEIYNSNLIAIQAASWVLAVIDDFDPGTIFEMGYAVGQGKPILAYSDVEGRGLNVMLAGAATLGFINKRPDLVGMIQNASRKGVDIWQLFPRNTWPGEIQ